MQGPRKLLPAFTENGGLPPGDYLLTLNELAESLVVEGPGQSPNWDRNWRRKLVENLAVMVGQLWRNEYHGVTVERAQRVLDALAVEVRTVVAKVAGELLAAG